MALITEERNNILKLVVAMFNAPAGATYLSEITNAYETNGRSLSALAQTLSTTGAYKALNPNFFSPTDFATKFLTPYGLQGNATAVDFIVSKFNAGVNKGQIDLDAATAINNYTGTDAGILAAKAIQNNKTAVAEYYSVTKAIPQTDLALLQQAFAGVTDRFTSIAEANASIDGVNNGASQYNLTIGLDNLFGTAGGTIFTANIVNNTNTFQSGDNLTGFGTGNVLNADLGNSANFAILATTKGIQTINITAESQDSPSALPSGTNNLTNLPVQINALRMGNVTNYGDIQSRADVIIENIQLPNGNVSNDATSAVTFTMRDTQPGSITQTTANANASTTGPSFRAYFNPQALKSASAAASSTVDVGLINSGPTYINPAPLKTSNYTGFTLNVVTAGVAQAPVTFAFSKADIAAIGVATVANNQAAVATAVNNAVDAYNTANNTNFTHKSGPAQPIFNSIDGVVEQLQTTTIGLLGSIVNIGSFSRSLTNDQDATAFIGNYMKATQIPGSTALITSNIIVDNVGQGGYPQFHKYSGSTEGNGGDILIGSMATSGGVQEFDIKVQRTSWNHSAQTTNNVLQVVNIISDPSFVPVKFDSVSGGGQAYAIGAEIVPNARNMVEYTMPGELVGTNGLRDVQTIDATKFNGSLEIGESIDYAAFVRYLQGSNAIVPFSIALGNNTTGIVTPGHTTPFNSVNLLIDAAVVASGNFSETITGGAGDSVVNLSVAPQGNTNQLTTFLAANDKWVDSTTSLQNVIVNVNSGNNTVKFNGAGAAKIVGGAGNDAYYIDNTGGTTTPTVLGQQPTFLKAVFVANAVANSTTATAVPTAFVNTFGGAGSKGTAQVSFVNVAPNTSAFTFSTVEDVAVNGTNSANANPGNPAGDDLQGVQVIYNQAAGTLNTPNPGISTATIAVDVVKAYNDYVQNHDLVTGLPNEVTPTNNFGGGVIFFKAANGGAPTGGITDVMVETFATPGGDTLQVTIGNEYKVEQTPFQTAQGVVSLTRTQVGPASFSYDGQTSLNNFGLVASPGNAPSSNGSQVNGTASGTEQDVVTFKNLLGFGASETLDGITITDTQVGGATTFTAAQVAAAVMAGNGTYGSLVVTGVGAATPPANTGFTPVNVYTDLPAGFVEIQNGVTVTNNTGATILAAVVAADVAKGGVTGVTVNFAGATPAAANVVLNYDTVNAVPVNIAANTTPVGTATSGISANNLSTLVSIDTYGNLTTNVGEGGAPLKTGGTSFTGVGETVTVTYQGVSSTVLIPSTAAGTYTTTDVNNAIVTAVNNPTDPTLSKLLHATEGSSNGSVILSSLVDGIHASPFGNAPTIVFGHTGAGVTTGTATGAYTAGMALADSLALLQISSVLNAQGDGKNTGVGLLIGGDSSFVNNSNISDSGSSGASNVIDLSSNNAPVNTLNNYINGSANTGSANTVTLTGSGNSVITNYKAGSLIGGVFVANDTINTVATHGVVINAVNDTFQMSYTATNAAATAAINGIAATTPGGLNIKAFNLGLLPTAGVDFGSTFASATHAAGNGAGIVVLENGNTTQVYYTTNVTNPTDANSMLEATLIGVTPAAALIHLV